MYINSISINESALDLGSLEFYSEVTINLREVTPHMKKELFSLYRSHCDVNISSNIQEKPRKATLNDFFYVTPVGLKVTKVIYHNPATIVFWSDGTKTVVKCDKNDTYDPEKGFYIACAKKLFGNNYAAVGRINKALEMAEDKNETN